MVRLAKPGSRRGLRAGVMAPGAMGADAPDLRRERSASRPASHPSCRVLVRERIEHPSGGSPLATFCALLPEPGGRGLRTDAAAWQGDRRAAPGRSDSDVRTQDYSGRHPVAAFVEVAGADRLACTRWAAQRAALRHISPMSLCLHARSASGAPGRLAEGYRSAWSVPDAWPGAKAACVRRRPPARPRRAQARPRPGPHPAAPRDP